MKIARINEGTKAKEYLCDGWAYDSPMEYETKELAIEDLKKQGYSDEEINDFIFEE